MKFFLISFLLLMFSTLIMADDDIDPFEDVNRSIDGFNQVLDENIFEPVAQAYKDSIPQNVQNRVSNFSSNLSDITTLGNEILQFEVFDSVNTFSRILINSTIGLFGLFDVASEIGLDRSKEDFGQTMAVWGVPKGPYVVLPILGPSTVRDVGGIVVDSQQNPELLKDLNSEQTIAITLVRAVNTRVKLLPATDLLKKADEPYIAARSAYLQKRKFDVYDGNAPIEEDEF